MSHPLHKAEAALRPEHLTRPWAAAQVERRGDELVLVPGGVFIAKADTLWLDLPERLNVVGPDGAPVHPSPGRKFFITAETFDPFHAVTEAVALPLPSVGATA